MKLGNVCAKHPELEGRRYANKRRIGHCPGCARESAAKYREANYEKIKLAEVARRRANPEGIRLSSLKWARANVAKRRTYKLSTYGFTDALFRQALELQGRLCPICKCDLRTLPTKRVHADHDHTSLTARGVLCHPCNALLGLAADSPERLINAAWYLMNPTLRGEDK